MIHSEKIAHFYAQAHERIDRARNVIRLNLTLTEKIFAAHSLNATSIAVDHIAVEKGSWPLLVAKMNAIEIEAPCRPYTIHEIEQYNSNTYFDASLLSKLKTIYGSADPSSIHNELNFIESFAFPGALISLIPSQSQNTVFGAYSIAECHLNLLDTFQQICGRETPYFIPPIIGIHLMGEFNAWISADEIILILEGKTASWDIQGQFIEFFGDGATSLPINHKIAVCQYFKSRGAQSVLFPAAPHFVEHFYSDRDFDFQTLIREGIALFQQDNAIIENPENYYKNIYKLDLASLEPLCSLDNRKKIISIAQAYELFPLDGDPHVFLNCEEVTSIEDLNPLVNLIQQFSKLALTARVKCSIYLGKYTSYFEQKNLINILSHLGVNINCDFACDGNTHLITNSPALKICDSNIPVLTCSISTAFFFSFAGKIANPLTDPLFDYHEHTIFIKNPKNIEWNCKFELESLATTNLATANPSLIPYLEPIKEEQYVRNPILCKIRGITHAEFIYPGAFWNEFSYNSSVTAQSLLCGVDNAFCLSIGKGPHPESGDFIALSQIAHFYREKSILWGIIAEENYGSSPNQQIQEYNAVLLRILGASFILAKSFDPYQKNILAYYGILPLTFADENNWDLVQEGDSLSVLGIDNISSEENLTCILYHKNGDKEVLTCKNSLNQEQAQWIQAGGFLNIFKKQTVVSC